MTHTDRLDDYLDRTGLTAVWFGRPVNFAWLTGASNVVDRGAAVGIAAAGYDGDGVTVVTDTIEAGRLADEELPDAVEIEPFPWYVDDLPSAVARRSRRPAEADFDVPALETIDPSSLRQPLTDADVDAYRSLGRDAAAAVEAVCRTARPSSTERELAAKLREELERRGVAAPVALVGGERRAPRYRHFVPADEEVGGFVLVSATAERHGLHASTTRTVAFDPPEWLDDRDRAVARVQTSALGATHEVGRTGGSAGDVFEAIRDAYADVGFPDEWRRHHQGGAAGFAGREWFARPDLDVPVRLPMAYAWNPTVPGVKSEDTWLVTEDGVEALTRTGDWPVATVEATDGSVSLPQPRPLDRSG